MRDQKAQGDELEEIKINHSSSSSNSASYVSPDKRKDDSMVGVDLDISDDDDAKLTDSGLLNNIVEKRASDHK